MTDAGAYTGRLFVYPPPPGYIVLSVREPIHYVFPFSFSCRRDVDQYYYITIELTVYL